MPNQTRSKAPIIKTGANFKTVRTGTSWVEVGPHRTSSFRSTSFLSKIIQWVGWNRTGRVILPLTSRGMTPYRRDIINISGYQLESVLATQVVLSHSRPSSTRSVLSWEPLGIRGTTTNSISRQPSHKINSTRLCSLQPNHRMHVWTTITLCSRINLIEQHSSVLTDNLLIKMGTSLKTILFRTCSSIT